MLPIGVPVFKTVLGLWVGVGVRVGVGAGAGICLEAEPEPEISKMDGSGNPDKKTREVSATK